MLTDVSASRSVSSCDGVVLTGSKTCVLSERQVLMEKTMGADVTMMGAGHASVS